jgi:hypothetical protein
VGVKAGGRSWTWGGGYIGSRVGVIVIVIVIVMVMGKRRKEDGELYVEILSGAGGDDGWRCGDDVGTMVGSRGRKGSSMFSKLFSSNMHTTDWPGDRD